MTGGRYAVRPDPRITRTGVVTRAPYTVGTDRVVDVRLDDDNTVTVACLRSVDAAVDDIAFLIRDRHTLTAVDVLGEAAAPPPPPPPPPPETEPDKPPEPTYTTVTLRPSTTGTARSGGWRPDTTNLLCGDWTGRGINRGAAFYASAGNLAGTVTAARLSGLSRRAGGIYGALAVPLALIANSAPAGTLTVAGTLTGPSLAVGSRADNVPIPIAWAQDLIDGRAGGIGITSGASSSPYIALDGRNALAASFTLTITLRS